jgi:translation elongation factor EF-4
MVGACLLWPGDTWQRHKDTGVMPLPGFKPAKSMVFAGLFPVSGGDFEDLDTVGAHLYIVLMRDASYCRYLSDITNSILAFQSPIHNTLTCGN